ncbi:MAG: hypothetical protein WCB27_04290 [Thermoguttaceae bacterium]
MTVKQLERAALVAHRRGDTWDTFWAQRGAAVAHAELYDRGRFNCLVDRLLSLVVAGDEDEAEPAGVEKTTETANQLAS